MEVHLFVCACGICVFIVCICVYSQCVAMYWRSTVYLISTVCQNHAVKTTLEHHKANSYTLHIIAPQLSKLKTMQLPFCF